MGFFNKLFGRQNKQEVIPEKEFSQEEFENDNKFKEQGLELVLGKMYGMVGHAIISFEIGGAVDMYYFPNHIQGTGFATMELLDPKGNGPLPNSYGTYELVAFTKLPYETTGDFQTSFDLIERRICGIFTSIGNYSFGATLKPHDTCEVPWDDEENRCLIFDVYRPGNIDFKIGERQHHLLLCLEIFRSEMDIARKNGGGILIEKLKQHGFYPYSDLDREPVA
jgi:hypothetical protein